MLVDLEYDRGVAHDDEQGHAQVTDVVHHGERQRATKIHEEVVEEDRGLGAEERAPLILVCLEDEASRYEDVA